MRGELCRIVGKAVRATAQSMGTDFSSKAVVTAPEACRIGTGRSALLRTFRPATSVSTRLQEAGLGGTDPDHNCHDGTCDHPERQIRVDNDGNAKRRLVTGGIPRSGARHIHP